MGCLSTILALFACLPGGFGDDVKDFGIHYMHKCKHLNLHTLQPVWNASSICHFTNYDRFGSFTQEDYEMRSPRQLVSRLPSSFSEAKREKWTIDPSKLCLYESDGYFNNKGLFFDCSYQYPLLMKAGRKDLDISMSFSDSPKHHPQSRVTIIQGGPLFSLVWPFNEYFSHSFTAGISLIPYLISRLEENPGARVLIPRKGPFQGIFTALGVSQSKLLQSFGVDCYYSTNAVLILRQQQPAFNLLQAHWPANALRKIQERILSYLQRQQNMFQIVNDTQYKETSKLVVYLSRKGLRWRDVENEEILLDNIRKKLKSQYKLVIFGRDRDTTIDYESERSRTHWMKTASLFANAAAVIGPHGGAFGNIFFCSKNTTIIEFNIKWTVENSLAGSNNVRDLFHSLARGIGNTNHYWFVNPLNLNVPRMKTGFYHVNRFKVDIREILAILRIEGFISG